MISKKSLEMIIQHEIGGRAYYDKKLQGPIWAGGESGVTIGFGFDMGYTTEKDLTSFGSMLTMGLVGMLVAMMVNWFLHSQMLDYIISLVGVAVFTGLTAYDVQKLKRVGAGLEYEGTSANDTKKLMLMGGLTLYLDFINLFLMLLRLFGGKRD